MQESGQLLIISLFLLLSPLFRFAFPSIQIWPFEVLVFAGSSIIVSILALLVARQQGDKESAIIALPLLLIATFVLLWWPYTTYIFERPDYLL